MADLNKTVEIVLKLVDQTKTALDTVTSNVAKLDNTVSTLQKNLDKTVESFGTLQNVKLPEITSFSNNIATITKADSKKVQELLDSLKTASGIKLPTGFTRFVSDIKELSSVTQLPSIKATVSALTELGSVSKMPSISKVITDLERLSKIGELPNIRKISSSLKELSTVSNIPSLNTLSNHLKSLSQIEKLPAIKAFVDSLVKLNTINKFPPMGALVEALLKFSTIGKLPRLGTFAKGLAALAKVKNIPSAKKLSDLANSIIKFGTISKAPDLSKLVKSLKGLQGLQVPTLSKFVSEVNKLATALSKLARSAPIIQAFNQINNAAFGINQTIKSQNELIQRNTSNWKKRGQAIKKYLQYRIIADSIISLKEAIFSGQQAIIDYDQSLKNLQAIMQSTEQEAVQMGEAIKRVASGTKFSATEVADGMQILGQSGLSAKEAIQSIGAVADLATGTLSDMSTSVDLITSAMRVFNLDATESAHIADVFANAVNASKLTVDKLRIALNYVGPVAASTGLSLEETSASLMTLANSGLRASTMGTGLRRILAELADPSDKMARAAENAGISLEELDPASNSLSDVLTNLGVVIGDTSTAFDIFGKRGAAAALTLTRDVAGGYDAMLEKSNRFGTAANMAQTQMEGLGVSLKNLQDKLKLVAVSLGEAGVAASIKFVVDALRELADGIVWLVENALVPFVDYISPLTDMLSDMNPLVVLVASSFVLLGTNVLFASKAFKALTLSSMIGSLKGLGTAASASATGVGLLSRAFGLLKMAATGLYRALGPAGILITGITALIGVQSQLSESSDKQIRQFQRSQDQYESAATALNRYIEELARLSAKESSGVDISKDLSKVADQLIEKYPDMASAVIEAEHSASALNLALIEQKNLLDKKNIQDAIEGLDGYVTKLDEAKAALDKNRESQNGVFSFFISDKGKEELKKEERELERNYNNLLARVGKITQEIQQANGEINWDEMFERANATAVAWSRSNVLQQAILEWVSNANKTLKHTGLDVSDSLAFTPVSAKWEQDLDEAHGLYARFSKLNIEELGIFKEAVEKINLEVLKNDKETRSKMLADAKARLKGLSGQELFEARIKYADEWLKYHSQINSKEAADNSVYLASRLSSIMDGYNAEIAAATKSGKTEAEIARRKFEVQVKYDKLTKELLDTAPSSDKLKKEYTATTQSIKAEYDKRLQDATKYDAEGTISHIDAERAKMEATLDRFAQEYDAAAKHYNSLKELVNADPKDVERAQKAQAKAYSRYQKAQTDYIEEQSKVRLGVIKQEYTTNLSELDTALSKQRALIQQSEDGVSQSHAQTSQRDLQATLDYYDAAYKAAQDYFNKVKGTGATPDDQAYIEALNKMNAADAARNDFRSKSLEDYNKDYDNAVKAIAESEKSLTDETREAASNRSNIDRKYNQSRSRLERQTVRKLRNEEEKHADKVAKIHDTLADKIESINRKLSEKIKGIHEDLIKELNDIEAKRLSSASSTEDKLRELRKRGKSDSKKEAIDYAAAQKKIAEGENLVYEARKEGDLSKLEAGRKLIQQAQEIGSGLDNERKAIGLVSRAGKALNDTYADEAAIAKIEARKKKQEEVAEAIRKTKEAQEKADKDLSSEEKRHTLKLRNIREQEQEQLISIKQTKEAALTAEKERHNKVMEDLQLEIEKEREKLAVASSGVKAVSKNMGIPVTPGDVPDTKSTSKSVDVASTIRKVEAAAKDASAAVANIGTTYTDTSKQVKEQTSSTDQAIRKVYENGKVVYTNLSDESRASFKIMAEAATSGSAIISSSLSNVDTSGIDSAKDTIQAIVDNTKGAMKLIVKADDANAELAKAKDSTEAVDDTIQKIDGKSAKATVSVVDQDGENAGTTISTLSTNIEELEGGKEVQLKVTAKDLMQLVSDINALNDNQIKVVFNVSNSSDVKKLVESITKIDNKTATVKAKVEGTKDVDDLVDSIDKVVDKVVKIVADLGNSLSDLGTMLGTIKDIVSYDGRRVKLSVHTRYTSSGSAPVTKKEDGGLISAPEMYNQGGSVFRRLANRFINKGSGQKDDVPALLMKGEYVHTTAAVRKYGRKFMDMINNLQLPVSAIPRFATGGPVDIDVIPHFNTGGVVKPFSLGAGFFDGILSSIRKRIEDMFGDPKGINVNIDQFAVSNEKIKAASETVTSGMGIEALQSMTSIADSAVPALASGGDINDAIRQLQFEKSRLNSKYTSAVNDAKSSGSKDIAEALSSEKQQLSEVARSLQESLTALKSEYDQYVAERTESYKKTIADLDKKYEESVNDENDSYNDTVADDTDAYEDAEQDYTASKAEALADYNDDLLNIADKHKATEYYDDLKGYTDSIVEAIKKINGIGKALGGNTFSTGHYEDGKFVATGVTRRGYDPSGADVPDFSALYSFLQKQEIRDSNSSAPDAYKLSVTKKEELEEALSVVRSSFYGLSELFNGVDGMPQFKSSNITNDDIVSYYGPMAEWDKESMSNALRDFFYNKDASVRTADYKNELAGIESDWADFTEGYAKDTATRDEEHSSTLANLLKNYTESKSDAEQSYKEDIANAKEQYESDVASKKTTAEEDVTSIKESTATTLSNINESMENTLSTLKEGYAADIEKIDKSYRSRIPSISESSTYRNPIDELIKKIRGGLRFNTGGLVPHTPDSVPGQDSILAALTPGEFVIKEPIVRALGVNFFKGLNGFVRPQFLNTGGLVGSLSPTGSLSGTGSTVTHQLALTINEKEYGPLQGDGANINDLLNDLSLAALRT